MTAIILLAGLLMTVSILHLEKCNQRAVKTLKKECDKRFKHYYKYEL